MSAAGQSLSPPQVTRDIELAQEAFERVHPGYDRYTDETVLDAAWQAIIADAITASGMSTEALYLRVQGVLALMRCGHTKAELPAALARARRIDPVYLPLRFELVEGRAIVIAVVPNSGVAVNDEVLSIDGLAIETLVQRYAPLIPVDGFTDYMKHFELAWSLEFSGGGIEHFMALDGVSPTAMLTLRDAEGAKREVVVQRIGLDAQRALVDPGEANFSDAVSVEYPDPKTAVLRVDTFVNYRKPVDPDDLYAPLFKELSARGIEHLIVDLRRNGGGSNDARDRLLAHLIAKRTYIQREEHVKTLNLDGLREHLSTWDSRALNPKRWWFSKNDDGSYRMRQWWFGTGGHIKPARHAFKGRLTMLSSGGNASGTTMLLGALQETGRARIVGELTGGNIAGPTAGVLFTLALPESKIRLRLPIVRTITGYDAAD
ncbi:MAG: S41 family peptidase, partial [Gammaproteobacteria bacterium]